MILVQGRTSARNASYRKHWCRVQDRPGVGYKTEWMVDWMQGRPEAEQTWCSKEIVQSRLVAGQIWCRKGLAQGRSGAG